MPSARSGKKKSVKKTPAKKINGPALYNRWIKALESGDYTQARSVLCSVDKQGNRSYCCLGVLCQIAKPNGFRNEKGRTLLEFIGFDGEWTLELPVELQDLVGLTDKQHNALMTMNDDLGFSFKQIARRLRVRNFTPRTLAADEKVK